jgi:hypothetical protein
LPAQRTANRRRRLPFRNFLLPHKARGTIPLMAAKRGSDLLVEGGWRFAAECATVLVCSVIVSAIGWLGVVFTLTDAGRTEQTVDGMADGQVTEMVPMKPGFG